MDAYSGDAERAERVQTIERLAAQITELAGHLNAANYRFLMLIAEFDRRQGWGGDGATHSCAHWLNCYRPFTTMSGITGTVHVRRGVAYQGAKPRPNTRHSFLGAKGY